MKRMKRPDEGEKPSRSIEKQLPLTDKTNKVDWKSRILFGEIHERIKAIQEAAENKDKDAVSALLELHSQGEIYIRDDKLDLGSEVLEALYRIGLGNEHVESIKEMLKHGNAEEREDAVGLLVFGEKETVVPIITKTLSDGDSSVRMRCYLLIIQMGEAESGLFFQTMQKMLRIFEMEADLNIISLAIQALGKVGIKDSEIKDIAKTNPVYALRGEENEKKVEEMFCRAKDRLVSSINAHLITEEYLKNSDDGKTN